MACSIEVKKELRDYVRDQLSKYKAEEGKVLANGTSMEAGAAILRETYKQTRDPASMSEVLEARDSKNSTVFSKTLKEQLGDIVYIDGEKHYVVSQQLKEQIGESRTSSVTLELVPANNLSASFTETFVLGNDTSANNVTINGIGFITSKASQIARRRAQNPDTQARIASEGDKEARETLVKMRDSDAVLGTRGDRTTKDYIGFHRVENYAHGDIESMKQILHKLHVLGSSKAPRELLQYYTQLLDQLHPRFFNQVQLFMKETNTEAWGEVNLNNREMYINIDKRENTAKTRATEAEIYMHETVHTMFAWALRQGMVSTSKIRRQLNHAMKALAEQTTIEDFLAVPASEATETDYANAKELRDYMLSSEHADEEFAAHILTNPLMIKLGQKTALKVPQTAPTTVFGHIVQLFKDVIDAVLGRLPLNKRDVSVYEQVHDLVFQLAEINNRHMDELTELNTVGQMMEAIDKINRVTANGIDKLIAKIGRSDDKIDVPSQDASLFKKAKFLLDLAVKGFTSPHYRKYIGLWASAFGMRPGSSLREFLAGFFERDEGFRKAEELKLIADATTQARNSSINAASRALKEKFKEPLTKENDIALKKVVLDTNLSILRHRRKGVGNYTQKELVQLLTDHNYLEERIGRIKHKLESRIKDESRYNVTKLRAENLGRFMVTGEPTLVEAFNAHNVVTGYGTLERYAADAVTINIVEELATLTALKLTRNGDKARVAKLIETETAGVNNLMDTNEAFKASSKAVMFQDTKAHYMDGYTMDVGDPTIDMQIAPLSEKKKWEQEGYKLHAVLNPKNGDTHSQPMAQYVTASWGKRGMQEGAMKLGTNHAKGTDIRDIKYQLDGRLAEETFKRDFARISSKAVQMLEEMKAGTWNPETAERGMAPVYDRTGKVTSYRYMQSRENKAEVFKLELEATRVLPRSIAAVSEYRDKELSRSKVLNAIVEDMEANWVKGDLGKDGVTEYIQITKNSKDPLIQRTYATLPDNARTYLNSRADKTIAVRADLFYIYFGSKNMSLSTMPGIKLLPGMMKQHIDMIEGFWKDIIKLSKIAIVIKMPAIHIANEVSNILLEIARGNLDIQQIFKDRAESWQEINEYIEAKRTRDALAHEIAVDKAALSRVQDNKTLSKKIAEKEAKKERLDALMARSDVHQFMEAGMYQGVIDDVDVGAAKENNAITEWIGNKMEKLPTGVRLAASWTYLNQSTDWYKASQEILMRTDLMARLAQNKAMGRELERQIAGKQRLPQWWLDKQEKGYPVVNKLTKAEEKLFREEEKVLRTRELLDTYINYTLPNGRVEHYLNDIGLLMFTKYMKRSQKVLKDRIKNKPVTTGLVIGLALMGLPTIVQSSLAWKYLSPYGIGYSPFYHIENVLTPPMLKSSFIY